MSKVEEQDPDRIVADAEERAREAQALVTAIEDRIMAGDTSVSHEDLSSQISVARALALVVEGARTKAAQIREQSRGKALEALRAEIESRAPESGAELVTRLRAVEDAAREYLAVAEAYSSLYEGWRLRLGQLDVKPGRLDHGVGYTEFGGILTDEFTLQREDGGKYLHMIFNAPYGEPARLLLTHDEKRRDDVYRILGNIGKADA
ncbi:hypothetical protein [Pseudolysinimonas sp.]|uniref:hypothetical protein n=1 Tax=Pseudolysinimonas sp. TaxID=2680009 RepID=UPI003F7DB7B4